MELGAGIGRAVCLMVLALGITPGCEGERPEPPTLRSRWDAAAPDPLVDALQVWRLGRDYFDEESPWLLIDEPHPAETLPEFVGLDPETARLLEERRVAPAVQFSCGVPYCPDEQRITRALLEGSDEVRLQALAVLMRVPAPASVAEQWRTLCELRVKQPEWGRVLAELESAFAPEAVLSTLRQDPPAGSYGSAPTVSWAARAAGVLRIAETLPRLTELSRCGHIHASLAAEKSLEEFPGEEGDRALASCLLGWRYDAYQHAARVLRCRNRRLLHETLLSAPPPEDGRYDYGCFLAWCDDPSAVPLLCETAPRIHYGAKWNVDFFAQIERLATRDHVRIVEALPERVRPDQRERAEAVVRAVRDRLGE